MNNIKDLRTKIDRLRGKQQQIESDIDDLKSGRKENTRSLRKHERAHVIIKEVGLKTQQQLQYHISDIASLAMEAVFDDPYKLEVEFVERRGKTECDLYFSRNGTQVDPTDASGGGAVDVAAFALRIASWSMQTPRTQSVIILDEPLRFLSVDMQGKASQMIKEISDRLGLQFIIITHEDQLTEYADKIFTVSKRKNKPSTVK